ncbi:PadR family transcriptional regulator [Microbacterium sp. A84]|uniref:PadR family transcriptional regulator n=1 Tax=Microbacterium sp. A84 TaxID=3450715 RepID=UPI003F42FED2
MKFEDVLLALVARHSASGYDLGQWLARDGFFVRANADQSQIYKALARLTAQGDVSFVVEKRAGAPDAKVYSPTPSGIARIRTLAASEYTPPTRWQEPDFTVRYGLFGPICPKSIPALIETEIAFRRAQIARFRNRSRNLILDEEAAGMTLDVATMLFEDMHTLNSASLDMWLEQLEVLRTKWQTRRTPAEEP